MVFLKSICFLATIAEISITSLSANDVDDMLSTVQPHTLEHFDEYLSECIGNTNELALLLDYDGTLAPIVEEPPLAILPVETKNILKRLSGRRGLYIAIISGRAVDDVKNMVGIEGLTYAGSSGLDIHFDDGTKYVYPVPEVYKEKFTELLRSLKNKVCVHDAWVENKGIMLTYHYRRVPDKYHPDLIKHTIDIINKFEFEAIEGKFGVEVKPPIPWDKGYASLHILNKVFGTNWKESVGVIYVGDDTNDEPAMRALRETGVTFRVDPTNTVPTAAKHRLSSTDDVLAMLKWVERQFDKRSPLEDSAANLSDVRHLSSGES